MQQSILITGANGQLGCELQKLIPLYPQFRFFPTDVDTLDLCDKGAIESFLKKNRIDFIINCAAYTAVDKAEDDIALCYRINRDAVQNLAEAAGGNVKIIHISTDYVFDGTSDRPLRETDKTNPQSVYGKSKLEGEQILLKIATDSIIIRTAWLYSSFGNNFVKTMIRLGKEKESLNVVNDQIGTPTNAADLAKAILQIIEKSEKEGEFQSGIYHYSNEGVCSWYDFCLKIHELAGIKTCKVHPVSTAEYPTRAVRPAYSVLDKTKIKKVFHLAIPDWKESLKIISELKFLCLAFLLAGMWGCSQNSYNNKIDSTKNNSIMPTDTVMIDSLTQKARFANIGDEITVTGTAVNFKVGAAVYTPSGLFYLDSLYNLFHWGKISDKKVTVTGRLDVVHVKGIIQDTELLVQGFADDFDAKIIRNAKWKLAEDSNIFKP